MGLETATYISGLVTTNPAGADDRSTADDHLRLLKNVLQNSFPNINGAVTASLAEINKLDGLTASQTELNQLTGRTLASNDDVIDNFEAGILALFQQSAAPTGWTKQTTHNDKAMRIVSGTASSGGSSPFTTVFGKSATDGTALSIAQMPAHTHTHPVNTSESGDSNKTTSGSGGGNNYTSPAGNSTGSGAAHTHPMDIRVEYVDVIIASKD